MDKKAEFSEGKKNIATLFVHGICGHYKQFASLPEEAAKFGLAETFFLPGHGGQFSKLLKTDTDDWLQAVETRLKKLSDTHDEVVLVGHSMGSLLSMYAAYKNPFKVKKMLLLATPFGISTIRSIGQKAKYKKKQTPKTAGVTLAELLSVPLPTPLEGIRMVPKLLNIITLSRRCEVVYPSLPFKLTCYQVKHDEIVPPDKSIKILAKNDNATIELLTESSHGYFVSPEFEGIRDSLISMLSESAENN